MLLLKSGDKRYSLVVASTSAERMLGLGRRASLPDSQGMLFVFNRPAEQCFWMKDMQFSLDIIWLSSSKRIEQIMTNVSPGTYPQTFCPPSPAKYVIELNAGQVKQAGIHTGEALKF